MRYAIAVKWIEDFKLLVTFDDHVQKIVDLAGHLEGPIFEPLHDLDYFKTVRVDPELDTIVWDNGADVAPEFLDEMGIPVGVLTPSA